jgi:hypothetical protein
MSKHSLGIGNKKGAINRPSTSHTSARALRLAERRKEAFEYRLTGASYQAIGETMKIDPSTAHSYVVYWLQNLVPIEKREVVLAQEIARLDQLSNAFAHNAFEGDTAAAEMMLRISHQRARLLGLYPNDKGGGVHVNIGTGTAEDTGIQVVFQAPDRVRKLAQEYDQRAKVAKVIEGFPVADLKPL